MLRGCPSPDGILHALCTLPVHSPKALMSDWASTTCPSWHLFPSKNPPCSPRYPKAWDVSSHPYGGQRTFRSTTRPIVFGVCPDSGSTRGVTWRSLPPSPNFDRVRQLVLVRTPLVLLSNSAPHGRQCEVSGRCNPTHKVRLIRPRVHLHSFCDSVLPPVRSELPGTPERPHAAQASRSRPSAVLSSACKILDS